MATKTRRRVRRAAVARPAVQPDTDAGNSADANGGTDASAGTEADDDDDEDQGPADGREYLAAVNKHHGTIATMGDVLGLLEYFGVLPAPESHARTPYQD